MSASSQHGDGTILMVFMFRGDYLTNELGHEIINLFDADDGKHYIYVNPRGYVNEKKYGKIDTILLVRHVKDFQVEIIAKASKLRLFNGATDVHLSHDNIKYNQALKDTKKKQNNECNSIRYGGKKLVDIFGFNTPGDKQYVLVTYEAGDFRRTKKNEYIDFKNKEIVGEAEMPRQPLTVYYYPKKENGEKIYAHLLKKIIEDDTKWESKKNSQKKIKIDEEIKDNFNYLNIIGKADDELAFSNWFHYYLKNISILNSFAKEVLSMNGAVKIDKFSAKTEVLREKERIDLLVIDADSKQMLVIENKIKSGINRRKKAKNQTQDSGKNKKDQDEMEEEKTEDVCQLAGYRKSAQGIAREKGILDVNRIKYYIFLPNYSTIRKEDCCGYNIVKYDEISKFFEKELNAITSAQNSQYYFDCFVMAQFVKALCRHKSSYPDSLFEDNYRQFIERIKELNSSDRN
jgi:hypothetical protein